MAAAQWTCFAVTAAPTLRVVPPLALTAAVVALLPAAASLAAALGVAAVQAVWSVFLFANGGG